MECSSSRKREEGNASFRSVSGTTTACSMCIFHSEKNEKTREVLRLVVVICDSCLMANYYFIGAIPVWASNLSL